MHWRAAVVGCFIALGCICLWPAAVARAGDTMTGKTLYDGRCAFCHGVSGQGDGPAGAALKPSPTNFTSVEAWKGTTLEAMRTIIGNGKPGTAMTAFKASLTAEQIDALLTYLQTFRPR
jgi:high-affinity iron transporter